MGKIEILPFSTQLNWAERIIFSLHTVKISYRTCLIFSIQVENGQEYQRRTTLNEAQWLYLIWVLLKQKNLA